MKLIKSYADLHQLYAHLYKYDVYRKSENYKAAIPQWDADQNSHLTNTINRYNKKCGCTAGGIAMCFSFLAYSAFYFICGGTVELARLNDIIELIICTLTGAVAGKLFGLLYARWRLIKFVEQLIS